MLNPFTEKASFDYAQLKEDMYHIVEAMDDVLEENLENHPLMQQRVIAHKFRNIGIGFMGLADALIKLNFIYGEEDSILMISSLVNDLFKFALDASVKLAEQRGSFPEYDSKIWDSEIIKRNLTSEELLYYKQKNCLRNCSLLSIAPTGSIGTMLNVSTGIEPLFRLTYKRKTESLKGEPTYYNVNAKVVDEYIKITNKSIEKNKNFITSNNIDYKNRIMMQAFIQKSIDTAISSTINLPNTTTLKDIENIYILSYKAGLKGVTVYVDGCRESILSDNNTTAINNIEISKAPKRPKELIADFYTIKVNGQLFTVLVGLYNNKPYEIFAFKTDKQIENHKGIIIRNKKCSYSYKSKFINYDNILDNNDTIEEKATTLYTSMLLRHGVEIKYINKTIKKVDDNIASFSSAICRILSKYEVKEILTEKCPDCGGNLIHSGGCINCEDCGYSKCG